MNGWSQLEFGDEIALTRATLKRGHTSTIFYSGQDILAQLFVA